MTLNTRAQRLRDELGITSGRELADHIDAPAVIYFLVRGDGTDQDDPRAEVHFKDVDGNAVTRVFRPSPLAQGRVSVMRKDCIQQATNYAREELDLSDWRRTVFQHCWLPAESIEKIQDELDSPVPESA